MRKVIQERTGNKSQKQKEERNRRKDRKTEKIDTEKPTQIWLMDY